MHTMLSLREVEINEVVEVIANEIVPFLKNVNPSLSTGSWGREILQSTGKSEKVYLWNPLTSSPYGKTESELEKTIIL